MTSFWLFSLKQTKKNKRCLNIKNMMKCDSDLSELGLNINVNLDTAVHEYCPVFSESAHAVSTGTRRLCRCTVVSPLESNGLCRSISSLTVFLNVITSDNMCFACMAYSRK